MALRGGVSTQADKVSPRLLRVCGFVTPFLYFYFIYIGLGGLLLNSRPSESFRVSTPPGVSSSSGPAATQSQSSPLTSLTICSARGDTASSRPLAATGGDHRTPSAVSTLIRGHQRSTGGGPLWSLYGGHRKDVGHTKLWGQQHLEMSGDSQDGGGAVLNGEFVNGKSVRDWTVRRSLYQALHMAVAEELERDPRVCIIGEDVGHYGGSYKVTRDLHFRHGNFRVLDTPICENTFTGMGIGAAMHGLRPVVEGMNMGFLLLAFNQIANNAGMVRATSGGAFDVPMVIRGPGGVGKQLGPEHSQRIEAYLMAIPGLKMVACSTPRNARGLLKAAIREDNPVIFFEHVLTYGLQEEIPLLPYTLPLDKAEIALPGTDITILAYSKLRQVALNAAEMLSPMNIFPEVIDLISLKPLDMVSIKASIKKTGRCLILDESSRTGGIGAEVFTQVVENCSEYLLQPPVRLATKDIPTPYARALEEAVIVTKADVVNAVLWMISHRRSDKRQL